MESRDFCEINYPEWLSVNELERMVEIEKESDEALELPVPNFFEIAMILLFSHKQENDPHDDLEELRKLVQSLKF